MSLLIQSPYNPKVKQLRLLLEKSSQRKKEGLSVLEGTHLILAYLQHDTPIERLFYAESAASHPEVMAILQQVRDQRIECIMLSDHLFKQVRRLGDGIDIAAVISTPQPKMAQIDWSQDSLILSDLQDAGNVGTLLRSAAAANVKQILCSTQTASVWSPRCLRAGMGAQFSLSIYEHIDLQQALDNFQLPIYTTSSHAEQSLYQLELANSCAFLVGNEGQGVDFDLLNKTTPILIPQPGGQESLNVAIAGSICLFEMVRQRSKA